MKTQTGLLMGLLVLVAVVSGFLIAGTQEQSVASERLVQSEEGLIGPWAETTVPYILITENVEGTDVAATAKVYAVAPEGFAEKNGRLDYDDASEFTSYTASSGEITVSKQSPGKYYVVVEASGYNTEFVEMTIPDGSNKIGSLADYRTAPDSKAVEMWLQGATTDKDFAFTLANESNADESESLTLKMDSLTEFRGWRAIVTDTEGFTTDADNDGIFDEGVKKLTVNIGGVEVKLFDAAQGVDEFDTNDKAEILLDNMVVQEKDFLNVAVDVVANTEDGTALAANDELWSEGEGVLGYIYIYDNEGTLTATVDITA